MHWAKGHRDFINLNCDERAPQPSDKNWVQYTNKTRWDMEGGRTELGRQWKRWLLALRPRSREDRVESLQIPPREQKTRLSLPIAGPTIIPSTQQVLMIVTLKTFLKNTCLKIVSANGVCMLAYYMFFLLFLSQFSKNVFSSKEHFSYYIANRYTF